MDSPIAHTSTLRWPRSSGSTLSLPSYLRLSQIDRLSSSSPQHSLESIICNRIVFVIRKGEHEGRALSEGRGHTVETGTISLSGDLTIVRTGMVVSGMDIELQDAPSRNVAKVRFDRGWEDR